VEIQHPFLAGIEHFMKERSITKIKWWLEQSSYPIQILRNEVEILIKSDEIQKKYGSSPVLVTFQYKNGRVIHMISHTHLQKVKSEDVYLSALIMTNIADDAVKRKYY